MRATKSNNRRMTEESVVYTQKRASSYIKTNKVMDLSCFRKMDATEDNINQTKSVSKGHITCFLSYVIPRFYIDM